MRTSLKNKRKLITLKQLFTWLLHCNVASCCFCTFSYQSRHS